MHTRVREAKIRKIVNHGNIMLPNGVSIITTTWNERENIEKLIPSIRNVLIGVRHEIIVVDDDSQDGTIEVASRLADIALTSA